MNNKYLFILLEINQKSNSYSQTGIYILAVIKGREFSLLNTNILITSLAPVPSMHSISTSILYKSYGIITGIIGL